MYTLAFFTCLARLSLGFITCRILNSTAMSTGSGGKSIYEAKLIEGSGDARGDETSEHQEIAMPPATAPEKAAMVKSTTIDSIRKWKPGPRSNIRAWKSSNEPTQPATRSKVPQNMSSPESVPHQDSVSLGKRSMDDQGPKYEILDEPPQKLRSGRRPSP